MHELCRRGHYQEVLAYVSDSTSFWSHVLPYNLGRRCRFSFARGDTVEGIITAYDPDDEDKTYGSVLRAVWTEKIPPTSNRARSHMRQSFNNEYARKGTKGSNNALPMTKRDEAMNPGVAMPLLVSSLPHRSPAGIIDIATNMRMTACNIASPPNRQCTY